MNIFKRLKPVTKLDSCDKMILWNLTQYLKSKDLRWWTAEFAMTDGLEDVMSKVLNEYAELTGNNSLTLRFAKIFKILRLHAKYDDVNVLTNAIISFRFPENKELLNSLVAQLKNWKYRIDPNRSITTQAEEIKHRSQSIKTEIELIKQKIQQEDDKETATIESQLISVGRLLQLKYPLNQKELTLSEWAELQSQARNVKTTA